MLDNGALGGLLRDAIDFGRIDANLRSGALHAVAVNATSYSTGFAITFFQAQPSAAPWRRTRREGRVTMLGVDHLLASTAIPFVFPAVRLGDDWYMDGSVRQLTPLSPALHLGARRVLVLSIGQFAGQRVTHLPGRIIAPGFVDMHIHFPQTDIIGSPAEGLLPWLENYTFPAESRFVDPQYAAGAPMMSVCA